MSFLNPELGRAPRSNEVCTHIPFCPCCLEPTPWQPHSDSRAGAVLSCKNCQTGRLTRVDKSLIHQQYDLQDKHQAEIVQEGVRLYAEDAPARRVAARNLLAKLQPHCQDQEEIRLLDVGAHTGFLVEQAAAIGIDATGIDVNPFAVDYGKNQLSLGERMIEADIMTFNPKDRFDAVVMANILGHLENPLEAVIKAAQLLDRDGYFLAQTPKFDNPFMKLPKPVSDNWRYFSDTYFWYFSELGMRQLLTKNGFEVISISHSRRPITIPFLAERALELIRIQLLEPLEASHDVSMAKVHARLKAAIEKLRHSSLQDVNLDLGVLGDSMDVLARKI